VSEQADMEQAASELVRWRAVRPDGTVLLDALTPSVAGWPGWRIDPETHVIGAQLGEGARPPWRVECRTEPDGIWYTWVVAEDGQLTWMGGRTDPDIGVHVLFHEVAVGLPVTVRSGESFTASFEVTREAGPDDLIVPGEVREVSGATGYPRRDIDWTTAKLVDEDDPEDDR